MFTRYETKKKLAFEISATQYGYSYDDVPRQGTLFLPELSETINIHTKTNNIEIGASVQYDISCKFLKEKCLLFKNLKRYIGLNVSMVYTDQDITRSERMFSDGSIAKTRYNNNLISQVYTGLSHTAVYNFKHIFLSSTATFAVDPFALTSDHRPYGTGITNTRVSLMIGAGYRF